MEKCIICGKEFKSKIGLYTHISKYEKISIKTYIDKYQEPYFHKCPFCNSERKWKNKKHYLKTCGSKECIEKLKQETNLEKYGAKTNILRKDIKSKIKEKYGDENIFKTENFRIKRYDTFYKNYGCEWPAQSLDIIKSKKKKYIFNNLFFDSSSELEFYKNHINQNIKLHPCELIYYFNNIEHKYIPDFELDGQLIEIKGKQFLKKDGTWQNPWNHELDNLYEAKHQCAIKNKVRIIYV